MTTNILLWSYLSQFFLECDIFQLQVVEKIKSHIMAKNISKNHAVYETAMKNMVWIETGHMEILYDSCALHSG